MFSKLGGKMLIELHQKKTFTLEEVRVVLPVIVKITKAYKLSVEQKMQYLEQIAYTGGKQIQKLEAEIDQLIQAWKQKLGKLGVKIAGLWVVDFDNGNGYYCWKYPEPDILFEHSYLEGYTQRVPIASQSTLQFM